MSERECTVSDWTAVAIQEGYRKAKSQLADANLAVKQAEGALQNARDSRSHYQDAVAKISDDAERMGIAIR